MSELLMEPIHLVTAKIASEAAVAAAVKVASEAATRQENIMGELKLMRLEFANLNSTVKRVEDGMETFKQGIGVRIQEMERDIGKPKSSLAVLESNIVTMGKIMWLIGGCTITALVAALLKLVMKGS